MKELSISDPCGARVEIIIVANSHEMLAMEYHAETGSGPFRFNILTNAKCIKTPRQDFKRELLALRSGSGWSIVQISWSLLRSLKVISDS
jgi:hypothetical protein